MSGFPALFQLSSLNGTNGFRLDGVLAGDQAGRAVSSAGDVNGDGFDDLIVGAPLKDSVIGGPDSGGTYVVFGKAGGFQANLNLSTLNGTNGFLLAGVTSLDWSGFDVSSAGDVNGDGFDDVIIGAIYADANGSNSGAAYVVFGKASGFAAGLSLSALNGANGFRISGAAANDLSGISVSSAGDVNGDGFDDVVVGASKADVNGSNSGASYVVFGKASGFAANLDLSALDVTNGFRINGASANSSSGTSVSSAGDFDGDGFADLIIGEPLHTSFTAGIGAAYVVFGRYAHLAATFELSELNPLKSIRFTGASQGDRVGISVSSAGDVNGDGFDDILIGTETSDLGGTSSGAAYVIFGKASGFAASNRLSPIDGSTLDGSNGFIIIGAAAFDKASVSLSSAGDVNGDGYDDLIIGAPYASRNGAQSGSSFVVFGKSGGFGPRVHLSQVNGTNGFRIDGVAAFDYSGWSVSGGGDINGDGFDDLIVGASKADPGGEASGASYVIFGRATGTISRTGSDARDILSGGEWDDTFNGLGGDDWIRAGDGDDTLLGGAGNDTIDGGADNDTIRGGSGNDRITGSLGEDSIDGGSGSDTLDFSAFAANRAVSVNLATRLVVLHDSDEQELTSIENATGSKGADTLTGNAKANVLNGSNGNDVISAGGGNDTVSGGSGRDIHTGGLGNDRFLYTAVSQSAAGGTTRDDITDFTVDPAAGAAFIDRIDVQSIDAMAGTSGNQAFTFIGTAAYTGEGQIRAVQSGANTLVEFNTAGTSGAEMQILLSNFTASNLTAADFIL